MSNAKTEEKDDKDGRKRRAARRAAIIDRKKALAEQPDTNIIRTRAAETMMILQIFDRGGDYALTKVRKGLGINYPVAEVMPKLERVVAAGRELYLAVEDICKMAGVDIHAPAGLNLNGGKKKGKAAEKN